MSIIVLLFALASPAKAAPDHVLLARIAVSESGWITPSGSNRTEARALYLVLRDRADRQGWTLRQAMQRYSPRATGTWRGRVRGRRCWVSTLDADLRRPRCWPAGLDWEGDFRPRWAARLAEALAVLADPPTWSDLAAAPLNHWGGAMDIENPRRYGWRRVPVAGTHNRFYCAPRLTPECRALR